MQIHFIDRPGGGRYHARRYSLTAAIDLAKVPA